MADLAYKQILTYLPADLREMLRRADQEQLAQLEELRLKPRRLPYAALVIMKLFWPGTAH